MWFRWEIGVRASSLRTSAYDGENVGPKAMKCVPLSLFNFIKGLATNFTKKFHNYTTKLITKRKKNVAEQCDMNAKNTTTDWKFHDKKYSFRKQLKMTFEKKNHIPPWFFKKPFSCVKK